MTKIDKNDLQNISLIKKELKLKSVTSIKIKKGNYEIEIFKFWESEFIALEIIESKKNPKSFNISDGVKNFGGYVY